MRGRGRHADYQRGNVLKESGVASDKRTKLRAHSQHELIYDTFAGLLFVEPIEEGIGIFDLDGLFVPEVQSKEGIGHGQESVQLVTVFEGSANDSI